MYKCEFCEQLLKEDEAHFFDNVCMCEDCFEEHTRTCTHCGELVWDRDTVCGNDMILCENCYDYNYTHCTECGCLMLNDNALYESDEDDDPYCEDCYNRIVKQRKIFNYGYKPCPLFYGDEPLYLGVELEIDKGGESNSNAASLLNIANSEVERIYCKHDGSLSSYTVLLSRMIY